MTAAPQKPKRLKAPWPYFGGKAKIAPLIWARLGNVRNYIEPFCGTLATLLARPTPPSIETVNDVNCFIPNFWRAIKADPAKVVEYCDWPVHEADLHARHHFLMLSQTSQEFRDRMRTDPHHFDARIAGWWVWGQCCWIGEGWCTNNPAVATPNSRTRPQLSKAGHGLHAKRPDISHTGKGINTLMHLPDISGRNGGAGRGILTSKRPKLSENGGGVGVNAGTVLEHEARRLWLLNWFQQLQSRLHKVRVCCGDWARICSSPSATVHISSGSEQFCGVMLDPPYKHHVETEGKRHRSRDARLYAQDDADIADRVRAWCLKWGSHPKMRIALCGYAGEHEQLEKEGWSVVSWQSAGGYGNRAANRNRDRERIWFSPACLPEHPPAPLFDHLQERA